MSRKHNPEIPQKLLDSLIRTVIEQGFSPSINVITDRAGVSKMSAYAQFTSRTGMTVAALERIGSETRRNLDAAMRQPEPVKLGDDISLNGVIDSLIQQITDRYNPIGFITASLLGYPDPRSRIHIAAVKEHAAIAGWLEEFFRRLHVPDPHKTSSAAMAIVHGNYVNVLASGIDAWKTIVESKNLLATILMAAAKEKPR